MIIYRPISIESGHVPDTMKLAKVIPIYKSKDKQMLNNYRPISLLPIFSKIIEKVIYQRLFNFLNSNNAFIFKPIRIPKKSLNY